MERTRRNHRHRGYSKLNRNNASTLTTSQPLKAWSFLSTLTSFLATTVLIAITYTMLQQHCSNCKNKFDMTNITKDISNMAINLSTIKNNYCDLEKKISRFSKDFPKLEGQIDILETLARNVVLDDLTSRSTDTQQSAPNNEAQLNRLINPQNNSVVTPLTENGNDEPR